MSLRKTIFDTMAMSSVGILRLLAQFIAIPILARILSPEDYGIVAIAMPFIMFSMMIADAGISVSLIRTPVQKSDEWSTCFWISIMLGAALAAIMIASAPFIATLYEEPQLSPIIMALAIAVLIQSAGAAHGSALIQEEKFKLLATIEVIAILASIAVAITAAKNDYGVWSLVLQQLTLFIIRVSLITKFSSFKPQRIFQIKAINEHIRFGKDMMSFNLISFFTRSIDNLIIGKVLGAAAVGVYSMAFQFARLPIMLVSGPLQSVFYSKMSKTKDSKTSIRRTFLILTRILATIIFPSMAMVAIVHDSFFTILLSDKWYASGRIFMLVSAITALQAVLNGLCSIVMMVTGQTRQQVRQTTEQGILWIITMFSTIWFGIEALAISYSVVFILYSPRILMLTLPLIDCKYTDYIKAITTPILVSIACIIAFLTIQSMFNAGNIMQLINATILMIIGIATSALLQYPVFLNEYRLTKNPSS